MIQTNRKTETWKTRSQQFGNFTFLQKTRTIQTNKPITSRFQNFKLSEWQRFTITFSNQTKQAPIWNHFVINKIEIISCNFNFERVWITVSLQKQTDAVLGVVVPIHQMVIGWPFLLDKCVFEHVRNIYLGKTHQGGYTPMVDQPVHRPPPPKDR